MPTGLSLEAQIDRGLYEIGCAEANFAVISQVVSKARLAQALSGHKDLEHRDAEKLLAIIEEMKELAAISPVMPDWKRIDQVKLALQVRRTIKKMLEERALGLNAFHVRPMFKYCSAGEILFLVASFGLSEVLENVDPVLIDKLRQATAVLTESK